ncbi:hypothetical protein SEA_CASSIA_61 [Arthrobacter phage Cassia]|uniref:Uncharacterized protein n=1 Tax=Arthrobacter phage Cassia TaxID=2927275 RepID=A0AAF0GIJ8_9CAUD|nr:hypothetical protein SEA_CASSIA_61 [Arthrobacter phage Cassia]
MISIPLDAYLQILRSMSPEDHPFQANETHADALGKTASAMAHAVADFIDVARQSIGYEAGRSTLEDLVHTFPVTEHPKTEEEQLADLLAALFAGIPQDALADEDDEEAPKGN